jgi:predicted DNA binding protein/putative methionine-R-sulfoxide reductase with GAF domain
MGFDDQSNWEAYAGAFETIAGWNDELFAAETEEELFRTVIDIALEELGLSTATVYRFDETAAKLRPEVTSVRSAEPVSPGENPIWEAFRDGTTAVCGGEETANNEVRFGHRIAVPLGDDSILIAKATKRLEETGDVVAVVRTLCITANTMLERIQYETQLRERGRELRQRERTLERAERILETYRAVSQAAISAETREDLDAAVCDQLVENDVVEFAWIGTLDRTSGTLSPRAWSGTERGYLERTPIELDESEELSAQAAREKEVRIVENVASGAGDEQWRSEALERGFRSAIAIPFSDDDILYGVLTAYGTRPNAFDGAAELAADTGRLIGHAITTIQCQNGLLAHTATELDVEITAPACFFVRFVRETETSVTFEAMSPAEDGSTWVFVRAENPERLIEYAERAATVSTVERLEGDAEANVVRCHFDDSFIGSFLSRYGITLKSASATPEEVQITASIPPSMTPRQALDIIDSEYPGAALIAKRKNQTRDDGPVTSRLSLLNRLTDRQREVVERAYQAGYFETPKRTTGKSLASSIDISTSAFHNHLRAAEAELFAWLFESAPE